MQTEKSPEPCEPRAESTIQEVEETIGGSRYRTACLDSLAAQSITAMLQCNMLVARSR